ncbi:MAG: class I tRNA ligase family protein, partial [Alphaproteobacteria bacterium]|nr:class I tRNA ligase family protein [Alphaproteobacteria bacterium]
MQLDKFDIHSSDMVYGVRGKLIDIPKESVYFGSMVGILNPREETRRHAHHDHENFLIISGQGALIGENEELEVRVGDIVRLDPGDLHTLKNTQTEEQLVFFSLWWAFSEGAVISKRDDSFKNLPVKRLIFSPPPTPNGDLHLGHIAGPYLSADILKRHLLQKGENALYITGSDEHQSYVELKARQMQISPKVIANQFSESIQSVLKQYNSAPDFFYQPLYNREYTKDVTDFFTKLFSSSALKIKICKQPYCEKCCLWLFEAHMSGICPHCSSPCGGGSCETCGLPNDCIELINSFCKYCKTKPILKETKQIYLPLQIYSNKLKTYLESIKLPFRIRRLVRDILDRGLPDLAITHTSQWGMAAPFEGFENQKLCSWCEMVPAYLFALHNIPNESNGIKNFLDEPKAKITLFFGFDNAYFYTIIMPALFLAYDHAIKLPTEIIYNEFYLFDNLKFSKSRSHIVLAKDIIQNTSSDALRYYLSATRPEFERTQFSYSDFVELINLDLIEGLSNWVSTLSSQITLEYKGVCP